MTNIKAKFINSISSILSKRQFNHDLTYVQMLTKRSTHPY
ncbi:Signal peptidase I [Legionella pneumophila subsp. pneumophila LPE509]|nr:Signal peptidase I [Legionella pneumophila subsp. pneumophila LPE509]